eukprot:9125592-Alexandrium_andersonii.AAC.1
MGGRKQLPPQPANIHSGDDRQGGGVELPKLQGGSAQHKGRDGLTALAPWPPIVVYLGFMLAVGGRGGSEAGCQREG